MFQADEPCQILAGPFRICTRHYAAVEARLDTPSFLRQREPGQVSRLMTHLRPANRNCKRYSRHVCRRELLFRIAQNTNALT